MDNVQQILDFEYEKFVDPEKRYAWQVRKQYQENYVEKGLVLARQKQNMTVQRYLDMTGISEIL